MKKKIRDLLLVAACTVLSAASFYCSTGLGDIWLLAWIAPLPLLWLAYGRQPLWCVAAATFVAFAIGNSGFIRPFAGMHAATIGIVVAIIELSVAAVVAVAFARFAQRRLGWVAALVAFPALWTSIEYISSLISPNGTVGSLAYTQVGAPVLIQSASLFGIWSITFLICFVANGSALALRHRPKALPMLAAVAVLFGANFIFGITRLQQSIPTSTNVAVAAQDRPAQRVERDKAAWLAITTAYAKGVDSLAAANTSVTTVVLPEKLATLTPEWHDAVVAPIAQAARDNKVRIVAGFEDDAEPAQNIAITFEPNGSSTTYVKRQLLGSEDDLTPGTQPGLLGGGVAVVICKDMDFPRMLRSDVSGHQVGLVLVPAQDFSVDRWMHSRIAVMRGVEGDYSVARAARRGDIQISDNRGRILARANSGETFVSRVAKTPTGTGQTLYLAIGDLLAWLCIGVTIGLLLFGVYRTYVMKKR